MATYVGANTQTEAPNNVAMDTQTSAGELNDYNITTEKPNEQINYIEDCDGTYCSHIRPWSSELNISPKLPGSVIQPQYKKQNSEHEISLPNYLVNLYTTISYNNITNI